MPKPGGHSKKKSGSGGSRGGSYKFGGSIQGTGKKSYQKPAAAPEKLSKEELRAIKHRKREKTVIEFDEHERQAFVGGFRKRKTERREYAQLKALENERKARVEDRARRRAEEKAFNEAKLAELRERMASIRQPVIRPHDSDSSDDSDLDETTQRRSLIQPRKQQQVFIDGERMITVTVGAGMEDIESSSD